MSEMSVIKKGRGEIDVRPDHYYSIAEIVIDMTGWATNDKSGLDRGIYPYCIRFVDSSKQMQSLYCNEMKSNGMIYLYETCEKLYNTVACDGTKITIICPEDAICNSQYISSRIHTSELYTFCDKAMDELSFDVAPDNNCRKRLESVLDYVCHVATIDYIDLPRTRDAVFTESIYDFEEEEQRLFEERMENPVDDDRYFE